MPELISKYKGGKRYIIIAAAGNDVFMRRQRSKGATPYLYSKHGRKFYSAAVKQRVRKAFREIKEAAGEDPFITIAYPPLRANVSSGETKAFVEIRSLIEDFNTANGAPYRSVLRFDRKLLKNTQNFGIRMGNLKPDGVHVTSKVAR